MARSFDTRPLCPALGAEIIGLDITAPLDDETMQDLYDAWRDNIVLLFNKKDMTQEEQLRFAACFGKIGERPKPKDARPEDYSKLDAAFMLVTNIRENGKPIGTLPDGEMMFHHDTIYKERPHIGTLLYAIEVPSVGGNTKFTNLYKAYDALPDDVKQKIDGRKALHLYDYDRISERNTAEGAGDLLERYSHPVAITHPRSGRKALYVNRLMTAEIEGLSHDESEEILNLMFDTAERPEHVYDHKWTPGDLLLWDNFCSSHARTDFSDGEVRLLRRCQVEAESAPAA
ncbi:MAG: taurine catabolism dioxygenase TauD [Rhodospirillaceae bacterium]|nr:taurine catabolism dioxygenase TauD [Rhodospirillaceae bacterium]|tara:strand:- start:30856 stop:31716 length:861 start_codon:yes stop_codon:yes gene_type:complete